MAKSCDITRTLVYFGIRGTNRGIRIKNKSFGTSVTESDKIAGHHLRHPSLRAHLYPPQVRRVGNGAPEVSYVKHSDSLD